MLKWLSALLSWCWVYNAHSQFVGQQYTIKGISYVYNTNNKGKRCFEWQPFDQDVGNKKIFKKGGKRYILLELKAAIRPGQKCALKILTPQSLSQTGFDPKDLHFEMKVYPPASTAIVEGPGFKDEILIEAPLEKVSEKSFFSHFKFAQISLETRGGLLSTTNPATSQKNHPLFPVAGGHVWLPFPGSENWSLGFHAHQSLGNFLPSSARAQLTDTSYELAYSINPDINLGAPKFSFILAFRSRNIFQSSMERPFLIGAWSAPGLGFDFQWFPKARSGFYKKGARWGYEAGVRATSLLKIKSRSFQAYDGNLGLSYRMSRKWTLSSGVGTLYQSLDYKDQGANIVGETYNFVYVRLSFLPFVNNQNFQNEEEN